MIGYYDRQTMATKIQIYGSENIWDGLPIVPTMETSRLLAKKQ
ncbi:MAG: hypothetical protein AAF587_03885 [Bacteroidota bacterium]